MGVDVEHISGGDGKFSMNLTEIRGKIYSGSVRAKLTVTFLLERSKKEAKID